MLLPYACRQRISPRHATPRHDAITLHADADADTLIFFAFFFSLLLMPCFYAFIAILMFSAYATLLD